MTDKVDLKAVLEALFKKRGRGRPKGIPKHPHTGRMKGSKNKSTKLKEELKLLLSRL
jgi:hypothetical protein